MTRKALVAVETSDAETLIVALEDIGLGKRSLPTYDPATGLMVPRCIRRHEITAGHKAFVGWSAKPEVSTDLANAPLLADILKGPTT